MTDPVEQVRWDLAVLEPDKLRTKVTGLTCTSDGDGKLYFNMLWYLACRKEWDLLRDVFVKALTQPSDIRKALCSGPRQDLKSGSPPTHNTVLGRMILDNQRELIAVLLKAGGSCFYYLEDDYCKFITWAYNAGLNWVVELLLPYCGEWMLNELFRIVLRRFDQGYINYLTSRLCDHLKPAYLFDREVSLEAFRYTVPRLGGKKYTVPRLSEEGFCRAILGKVSHINVDTEQIIEKCRYLTSLGIYPTDVLVLYEWTKNPKTIPAVVYLSSVISEDLQTGLSDMIVKEIIELIYGLSSVVDTTEDDLAEYTKDLIGLVKQPQKLYVQFILSINTYIAEMIEDLQDLPEGAERDRLQKKYDTLISPPTDSNHEDGFDIGIKRKRTDEDEVDGDMNNPYSIDRNIRNGHLLAKTGLPLPPLNLNDLHPITRTIVLEWMQTAAWARRDAMVRYRFNNQYLAP